jgi:hypothetical protein
MADQELTVLSWNISAVNTNPFEYWVTHDDPTYLELMARVEVLIHEPGTSDVKLENIFSHDRFQELRQEMERHNIEHIQEVEQLWLNEYREKFAIKQFLTDKTLGLKRLISMPDRITSRIHDSDGKIFHRPSVTNEYMESMDTLDNWWESWKKFMFGVSVKVVGSSSDAATDACPRLIYQLIDPILRSKYPAISIHEQLISTPLQILCLALYDAVLWWIMDTVAKNSWQSIKHTLCYALIKNKFENTINIIRTCYSSADIIFLQESAAAFVGKLNSELDKLFLVIQPKLLDGRRDQNSLILVRRTRFYCSAVEEITDDVLNNLGGDWVAPGDLIAVSIQGVCGRKFLLASFHGDSNGLSTQPLMIALNALARDDYRGHVLVCGLDANTDSDKGAADAGPRSLHGFNQCIRGCGMISCWGAEPDPALYTTCNSRTSLQPQLHKAVRMRDRVAKAQRNLKDWIVAFDFQMQPVGTARDNSGRRLFTEDIVFPTLHFPSDHAIVSTRLTFQQGAAPPLSTATSEFFVPSVTSQVPAGLASDTASAAGSEARHGKGRVRRALGMTLYDYWKITDLVTRPQISSQDIAAPIQPNSVTSLFDTLANNSGQPKGGSELLRIGGSGSAAQDAIDNFLVEHFRTVQSVLKPLQTSYQRMAQGRDKPIWVIFSPRPFSTAFPKPLYLFLFALVMTIFCAINVSALLNTGDVIATHFRVTPLATNATDAAKAAASLRVQPLLNGCRLPGMSANQTVVGSSVVVSYPEPVHANGVSLLFAGGGAPGWLRFELETSSDGAAWAALALPGWLDRDTDFRTVGRAVGDDGRATLDLAMPWPWTLWSATVVAFDAAVFVAIFAGWCNRGRLATRILAATYLIAAVLTLAAAGGCGGPPYRRLGFRAVQDGWLNLVFALGVWTEIFLVELVVLGNLAHLALQAYYAADPLAGSGKSATGQALVLLGFALASVFGGWLWVLRVRAWAWIRKQVAEDEQRYAAAFEALERDQSACLGLRQVREACEEMMQGRGYRMPHQQSGLDLDQLYSQAGFLHFLLKDKVSQACGRILPCAGSEVLFEKKSTLFEKWQPT